MKDHDWRLVPSAGVAWFAAWLGVSGYHTVAVWFTVLGAASAVLVQLRWVRLACLVFVAVAITSLVASHLRHAGAVSDYAQQKVGVTAQVRVTEEARLFDGQGRPALARAPARLEWFDARGQTFRQSVPVVLTARGDEVAYARDLRVGGRYLMRGVLSPPDEGDAESAVLSLSQEPRLLGEPGPLHRVAAAARQGIRDATAGLAPEQAALVPSLVVGDTSRITEQMEHDFKVTALTHLMAVSGANLTLMLGVVLALARGLGARGWLVRGIAAGGVGMFVLVCGPEPSVLRAAVMGLIALAATGVGKGRRSLRALSVCVIALLLIDPWLARSFGFALSVSACAGIVLLTPTWIETMTRWCPRWVAEAFSVPLAAQLATTPLIVLLSSQISVVGVLSNLLAAPFVGPTTVLGFAAAAVSWWPALASLLGWAAGWAGQPILWIARATAALPGASAAWPPGWFGVGVAIVMSVCAALLVRPLLSRWWSAGAVVASLVLASFLRPPVLGWPMDDWRVAFCAVGQGDATVLRASARDAVLVDAGPDASSVLACLDALDVSRVPMVVLTHYHADHIGGLAAILERYDSSLVLVSALPSPATAAESVRSAVRDAGAEVRVALPGETISVGDVVWSTITGGEWALAPAAEPAASDLGESSEENDASVVGVAEVAGIRVLLPGDTEPEGQRRALALAAELGISMEVDVLKLPHHGSSRQDEAFFRESAASVAVASSGVGNSYGHPSAAALRLSQELGMTVLRTDEQGSIALAPKEGALAVLTSGREP